MMEAFRQHFTKPLSKKEAGQLFNEYLRNGWIDIWWNDHTGKYVVTMVEARKGSPQPVQTAGFNRDRGQSFDCAPPTPPDVRVRIRRFVGLSGR